MVSRQQDCETFTVLTEKMLNHLLMSNYFIFHIEENITVVPCFTAELARVLNIHFIELTLGSMHDVIVFCCKSVYTVFGTDVKTLNVREHKNACIKFGRFTAGNTVARS